LRDEHPEALLKSALEKIVYFEARSQQLHTDLAAAQGKIERFKEELTGAAQREIELRRELAEFQVEVNRSRHERDELDKLNDALRAERAALLGKLIEAARIHDSDKPNEDGESPFDLASFISELRSEALAPKQAKAAAEATSPAGPDARAFSPGAATANGLVPQSVPAAPASAPSPVAQHAARLRSEGRLAVSHEQVLEMSSPPSLGARTEETLFSFSVRELASPDPAARKRAAERLKALGNPAASAAVASALHEETQADVQVALLGTFSGLAKSEGVPIIAPMLRAELPEVRIAALKALIALDPAQAGPHVAAAIKDADRAVRRRASLLALGLSGSSALKLGEQAIVDEEPEVRSLAALVLGASNGERARVLLLEALTDRDPKVREAAAQSLSRILGKDVSPVVELDDPQRRREVRRLAALPVVADGRSKVLVKSYFNFATQEKQAGAGAAGDHGREQAAAVAAPPSPEELCTAVMSDVRGALRGCSLAELAASSKCAPDMVQEACELLVARGQVVRRGLKYFAA
jgi:hypothetical protein